MPPATYLPDPKKWISTTPASTAKAKPKNRPLTALRNGLPTPPTSTKRTSAIPSSSASARPRAAPSSTPRAQPGLKGYLARNQSTAAPTPPMSGRRAEERDKARMNKAEPSRRVSRLDVFSDEDAPSPGPSRRRGEVTEGASRRANQILRTLQSFGPGGFGGGGAWDESGKDERDGEGSGTETETDEPPPRRVASATRKRTASPEKGHLAPKTPRVGHVEDPALAGYTPPMHSPRLLTQPPLRALASHWRINGLASRDDIAPGEEPWGRTKAYRDNEVRRRRALQAEEEADAREEMRLEQNAGLERGIRANDGQGLVERGVREVRPRLTGGLDLFLDVDSDGEGDGEGEKITLRARSPRRAVQASGAARSPQKKEKDKGTRLGALGSNALNPGDNDGVSRGHTGRAPLGALQPNAAANSRRVTGTSPRKRKRSISPDPSRPGREYEKEDTMYALPSLVGEKRPRLSPVRIHAARIPSKGLECPEHRATPQRPRAQTTSRQNHMITPPRSRQPIRQHGVGADDYFALPPPPAPAFSSSPTSGSSSGARAGPREGKARADGGGRDFKAVEVVETLATWSQGLGDRGYTIGVAGRGPEQEQEQGSDGSERKGDGDDAARGGTVTTPETQSLAPTVHSQSLPRFLPSPETHKTRPLNRHPSSSPVKRGLSVVPPPPMVSAGPSRWSNLTSGILAPGATVDTPPEQAVPSASKKRARPRASTDATDAGKQVTLQAFGIVSEKRPSQRKSNKLGKTGSAERPFELDFEEEEEVSEGEEGGGAAGAGEIERDKKREGLVGGVRLVDDAPLHPGLRPAGVRALRQREAREEEKRRNAGKEHTLRASGTGSGKGRGSGVLCVERPSRDGKERVRVNVDLDVELELDLDLDLDVEVVGARTPAHLDATARPRTPRKRATRGEGEDDAGVEDEELFSPRRPGDRALSPALAAAELGLRSPSTPGGASSSSFTTTDGEVDASEDSGSGLGLGGGVGVGGGGVEGVRRAGLVSARAQAWFDALDAQDNVNDE